MPQAVTLHARSRAPAGQVPNEDQAAPSADGGTRSNTSCDPCAQRTRRRTRNTQAEQAESAAIGCNARRSPGSALASAGCTPPPFSLGPLDFRDSFSRRGAGVSGDSSRCSRHPPPGTQPPLRHPSMGNAKRVERNLPLGGRLSALPTLSTRVTPTPRLSKVSLPRFCGLVFFLVRNGQ